MTIAQIQKSIIPLVNKTDTQSKIVKEAVARLAKEVTYVENFVLEEDRVNQAINRLVKVWSRQAAEPYKSYIRVISRYKNNMYSFSEIEKLSEDIACPTFTVFLNKVRQELWAKYASYSDLRNIYNLRHLDEN